MLLRHLRSGVRCHWRPSDPFVGSPVPISVCRRIHRNSSVVSARFRQPVALFMLLLRKETRGGGYSCTPTGGSSSILPSGLWGDAIVGIRGRFFFHRLLTAPLIRGPHSPEPRQWPQQSPAAARSGHFRAQLRGPARCRNLGFQELTVSSTSIRRRGPASGRWSSHLPEPLGVSMSRTVDEISLVPRFRAHLDQAIRVRAVLRATNQQKVGFRSNLLHSSLAVLGG